MSAEVALSDVIEDARPGFACGETDPEGVVQIRMNNVSEGTLIFDAIRRVPTAAANLSRFEVKPNDVLFNATNSPELVGKAALFKGFGEPVVYSNHFIRLRTISSRLDAAYLSRWLHLIWQRGDFSRMCKQWVNQASVASDRLLSLRIPLPPLSEQRRIAAILDKADELRAKRWAALEQLDGVTQALFLEMFGDPVTNPKGLPRLPLRMVGTVVTGNTPSRDIPDYFGDGIEWIKSDNINTAGALLTPAVERLSAEGKAVARTAPSGSILVTCIAGTPACIGNAAIADREVAFNQQINALIPAPTIDPYFLYCQFVVGKKLVQQASTGGMKGLVSKSRFEAVQFIVPPQPEQVAFGRHFMGIQALLTAQHTSLNALTELFTSLQDRAFSGAL